MGDQAEAPWPRSGQARRRTCERREIHTSPVAAGRWSASSWLPIIPPPGSRTRVRQTKPIRGVWQPGAGWLSRQTKPIVRARDAESPAGPEPAAGCAKQSQSAGPRGREPGTGGAKQSQSRLYGARGSLPKGHPERTPYGVTTNTPNKANSSGLRGGKGAKQSQSANRESRECM